MAAAGDVVAEDFVAVAEAFLVEEEVIHVAATVEVATRAAAMEVVAIHEAATAGVVTAVPARCSGVVVAAPAISPADLAEAIFLHPIFLEGTFPPGPQLGRGRAAVGEFHRVELSDQPPERGPLAERLSCLPAIALPAAKELVRPNNLRAVAQSPRAAKQLIGRRASRRSFLPKAQETFWVQRPVPALVRLSGARSPIGVVA